MSCETAHQNNVNDCKIEENTAIFMIFTAANVRYSFRKISVCGSMTFLDRKTERDYGSDQEEDLQRPMTWGGWEPHRLESRGGSGRRYATIDEGRLEKRVRPKWSDKQLREITRHDVQLWVCDLER